MRENPGQSSFIDDDADHDYGDDGNDQAEEDDGGDDEPISEDLQCVGNE